jgi:hypothetical protein
MSLHLSHSSYSILSPSLHVLNYIECEERDIDDGIGREKNGVTGRETGGAREREGSFVCYRGQGWRE